MIDIKDKTAFPNNFTIYDSFCKATSVFGKYKFNETQVHLYGYENEDVLIDILNRLDDNRQIEYIDISKNEIPDWEHRLIIVGNTKRQIRNSEIDRCVIDEGKYITYRPLFWYEQADLDAYRNFYLKRG